MLAIAASNVFAELTGSFASIGPNQQINLTTSDFILSGKKTVLGFLVKGDSLLDPGAVQIRDARGAVVKPEYVASDLSDKSQSLVLAELGFGTYSLYVPGDHGTSGGYTVDVFLPGDVNGDRAVTKEDKALLKDGKKKGEAGYVIEADANLNGVIDNFDKQILDRNIGSLTNIDPLSLSANLSPSPAGSLPIRTPLTNKPAISATGTANTGATVKLDKDGDGFDDGTITVGAGGTYQLPTTLIEGLNVLRVLASDTFGQQRLATLPVALDTIAPAQPVFDLDAAFDTAPVGDHQTTLASVTLAGQTEAGVSVKLNQTGATTTADTSGKFQFTSVSLALGANAFTAQATDGAGNVSSFSRTITRVSGTVENDPPVIRATLTNDTGASNSDGLTFDDSITGTVSDASGVASFKAGFDSTPAASFFDVFADIGAGGVFAFSPARLNQINGVALSQGAHTLHLIAADTFGNTSQSFNVAFALDTLAPAAPAFDLDPLSDAAPVGDLQTTFRLVNLKGQTDAGIAVSLLGGSSAATAAADGKFSFPNVVLSLGANSITLRATDLAGNQSSASHTITRLAPPATSNQVVIDWNNALLQAIQTDASAPPMASRSMAIVQAAIFDALNAVEGAGAYLYVKVIAPGGASPEAAVASAAHEALLKLYPAQQATLDAQFTTSLASIAAGQTKTDGINVGKAVADALYALRSHDGFNKYVDYSPGNAVGVWQPTYPMYGPALLPNWATLTPFTMDSNSQFRPAAPPAIGSAQYDADFNQVKDLGKSNSITRTADQTQIARFWADGAGTITPAGHWNEIATQLLVAKNISLFDSAKLLAQLNVALSDASIVAWDAKYTYNGWRPMTAIQNAAADGDPNTNADATWTPLLVTPAFPGYISGHSTYSGAADRILSAFFGASTSFTTGSPSLAGVTRSFASFTAAANEASLSRIFGGIHFRSDCDNGLTAGRALGDFILQKFSDLLDKTPPTINITSPAANAAEKSNFSLSGAVLDGLSGISSFKAQIDSGASFDVVVDASGGFAIPLSLALNGTADGGHLIHFIAIDGVGNTSTVDFQFTLDTKAPAITVTIPAASANLTAGVHVKGTADGTGGAITSLVYNFDSGLSMPVAFNPSTGLFDQALDLSKLGAGPHVLKLTTVDAAGNSTASNINVNLASAIPLTISGYTPANGSSDVGSTFRPKISFSRVINASTLNANNFYATNSTGAKLPATIVPASDGSYAWLFFTNAMPGASTIKVTVDGSTIKAADNALLDAAGTGTPGSKLTFQFTTVSLTGVPNTSLFGTVADPGPDLKPGTFDDVAAGPDGVLMTADDVYKLPIAGVTVSVAGTALSAITGADGKFSFSSVPTGDVKLVVNGMTATSAPTGLYFPEMVMDLSILPGVGNTVMAGMLRSGTSNAPGGAKASDEPGLYLSRLRSSLLQTVSNGATTTIGVDAGTAPDLTDQQRQALHLTVSPNSLIGTNGQPMSSAQIGISTVPPELVMDMLPAGVMQHTFDITIQAPGVATFATPVQVSFPNVFDAAPGTQLQFLSFDHTTGRLVIEGTATVSADGKSVVTDPGQGVTHPGWHGLPPPGSQLGAGPGEPCPDPDPLKPIEKGLDGAADVGKGAFDILNNANSAVKDIGEAIDKDVSILGKKAGAIFKALGVVDDIHTLFSSSKPWYERLSAGSSLALDGILLFVGSEEIAVGALVLAAAKTASVLNNMLGVAGGIQQIQDGVDKMKQAINQPPCNPPPPGMTPQDVANQAQDEVNQLRQLATDTLPKLDQLQSVGPQIGDILKGADGTQPNWGLPDDQVAKLVKLLDDWSIICDGIPDPFWQPAQDLAGTDGQFNDMYTDPVPTTGTGGGTVIPSTRPIAMYWMAEFNGATLRGRAAPDGSISFFAGPDLYINLSIFDPVTGRIGQRLIKAPPSGTVQLSKLLVPLLADNSADTDADLLRDAAERIVGTQITNRDTDGDGITDGVEVKQDTNPLDGIAYPTGIIANQTLQGQAKAVVVTGSTTDPGGQTAYVATGTYGLAILNVGKFDKPLVLGQLSFTGDATDVAVDSNLNLAAIADNAGGLVIVNVADPTAPTILRTLNINATQVEVLNGVVYTAVGGTIQSYDMQTGDFLQTLSLGATAITQIARDGQMLYTMNSSGVLQAVDISGPLMIAKGTLAMTGSSGQLFVGNGIAYVGAGSGFTEGFLTANVSNPNSITLLSGVDAANIAGGAVVANGSGLAVTIGSPGGAFGANALDVVNVADPTNTGAFLTRFPLPQAPMGVAIASGIAYVADGSSGLLVVNYRAFDNKGIAPLAAIDPSGLDVNPITAGVQVIETSIIPIKAVVSDDVQVRNVDLLVNGTVVQNAVSFPFNLNAIMPALSSGQTSVTIQVRATDTGGNVTTSAPLVLNLVQDTSLPQIVSVNPTDGSTRGQGPRTIQINFSKGMDPATLIAANFVLTDSSNNVHSPTGIQLRNNNKTIQLTYASLIADNYTLTLKSSAIKDPIGNALGASDYVTHFKVAVITATFNNPAGGFWDDPNNWDTHVVPGPADDVAIEAGSSTVTFRQGTVTVHSVIADSPLRITGGTLTVTSSVVANKQVTLAGGALAGATLVDNTGNALQLLNGTLNGVTINGDFSLAGGRSITVTNGLTLNGTATFGDASSYGFLQFGGVQSLNGSGNVVFGGPGPYNALALTTGTLTIGSGITIKGQTGYLGFSPALGGTVADITIINNGTIQYSTGSNIQILSTLTNNGTISVSSTASFAPGGAIVGGAITTAAGAHFANGILDGVTINGDFTVENNQTLSVKNGLTLNGTATLGGNASYGFIQFAGTQTLSGTGAVVFSGAGPYNALALTTGTLTLGPNITVRGTTGYLGFNPAIGGTLADIAVINNGTIQYSTNSNIQIPSVLTNNGTISVSATGSFAPGGKILGGTITTATGAHFGSSTLDGVTINGDFSMDSGKSFSVKNGLTLNGTATLGDATTYGYIQFVGDQTLAGSGNVVFGGPGPYNALALTSGTLTIGSGITVKGQTGYLGFSPALGGTLSAIKVINKGIIQYGSGSNIQIPGTLTNNGIISVAAGANFAPGGTISSGTITSAAGAQFGSAILDAVTVSGDFTVAGSHSFTVINGLTLNGTATLGDASSYGYIQFSGDQTLSGTGTVVFSGAGPYNALALTNNTLTIGANITVRGQTGYIGFSPAIGGTLSAIKVINQGTIQADVSGGTITINGTGCQNSGALKTLNGGTLAIAGTLTNTGTVLVDGTSFLSGGGTLTGATMTAQTGANIYSITLDAATISGAFTVNGSHSFTVKNGLTLNGTATLGDASNYGFIQFIGDQTLSGSGNVVFGGPGPYNALALTTGTLTIGSGITIKGQTGYLGFNPAIGGTQAAIFIINNGTIQYSTGSNIQIVSTLTNNGTISVSATGTFAPGGTILGGAITSAAGAHLASAILDGVTINGDFTVDAGQSFTVKNGLTLNGTATLGGSGNYGFIQFVGNQSLAGTGTVVFNGAGPYNALALSTGTLTIGPSITVRGQTGYIGLSPALGGTLGAITIVNLGTIQADIAGGTVTINSASSQNSGTLKATNGGALSLAGALSNTGTLWAGAGSAVAVNGDLTLASIGTLRVDIGGTSTTQFGRINITGAATLAGTLSLQLVNGFVPGIGNSFQMTSFASRSGVFDTILGTDAGNGHTFSTQYNATNITEVVV